MAHSQVAFGTSSVHMVGQVHCTSARTEGCSRRANPTSASSLCEVSNLCHRSFRCGAVLDLRECVSDFCGCAGVADSIRQGSLQAEQPWSAILE